jgi:hypothetical protein
MLGVVLVASASEPVRLDDNSNRGLQYSWNQAELHHDLKALDALLATMMIAAG